MKKLIFLFAMVFAVSMAMAQHSSTVTETGNDNSAMITQGFDGSGAALPGNVSTVDQTGNENDATVLQMNNGYGGQNHNSDIDQMGDMNSASVEQQNATGDAFVEQIGDGNTADVLESGNFGMAHPAAGLAPYDAYVSQTGDNNEVYMTIYGTDAASAAIQNGDDNLITQQLGQGNGDKVQNSSAYANQQGDRNEAMQVMEGQGFAGDIDILFEKERIWQTGDGNYAYQLQTDDNIPGGLNYAEVRQTGDWNESWQTQTGLNNSSIVTQNGDMNWSTSTQIGNENEVVVQQN